MSPEERITRLETQMINVLEDYRDMREEIREVSKKLDAINATLTEARGGWRMLMLVGGAGATVGGLLVKYLPLVPR